ncbi:MAG: PEP-CTERM sorting domain-containing protein [Bryobacterales bacterium]|nr:PEP-CTERM sorting domain-containing protein [Bryobacterales bacterium]
MVYEGNIIEGLPGDQGLPFFLSGSPNNLRLRYFVPNYASLVSINSISVSVDVYDDGDANNNEELDLVFVLNGIGLPNLAIGSHNSGLNGTDSLNRQTVLGAVNAGDLGDALLEIQGDGVFFIRVNRNGGDFFVHSATVTIDGEAVPEPGTLGLCGVAGLLAAAAMRRRN